MRLLKHVAGMTALVVSTNNKRTEVRARIAPQRQVFQCMVRRCRNDCRISRMTTQVAGAA